MTPHLYIKYDEKPPGVHKAYIREYSPGRGGGGAKNTLQIMSLAAYASETNKSTTILPRVGLVISWTKPWSSRQSVKFRVNLGKRHVRNRQLCSQSNPRRFMSPAIQICDEVSPLDRWSDLSKFSKVIASLSPSGLTSKFPEQGYQVW